MIACTMKTVLLTIFVLKVCIANAIQGVIHKRSILEDFDPCIGEFKYNVTVHCPLPVSRWRLGIIVKEDDGAGISDTLSDYLQVACYGSDCNLLLPFTNEPTIFEWRDIEVYFIISHDCTSDNTAVEQYYVGVDQHKCRDPAKEFEKTVHITLDPLKIHNEQRGQNQIRNNIVIS